MSNQEKVEFSLDVIDVASPCSADWAEMTGDDQVRHCEACDLNVYNLSEMTREDAEQLIRSREGNVCVRFYRRHDGTVISQDCPVGLRAARKKVFAVASATVGLLAVMLLAPVLALAGKKSTPRSSAFSPLQQLFWQSTPPVFMGSVCPLPPGPPVPVPSPTPSSDASDVIVDIRIEDA